MSVDLDVGQVRLFVANNEFDGIEDRDEHLQIKYIITHPFKDKENEGKHHGTVRAVGRLLGVALVVGPRGLAQMRRTISTNR